ncbi:MAG: class I SAM-dependent methyltransferase [Rudaea sp.]
MTIHRLRFVQRIKATGWLYSALILPFYFLRFVYFSLKGRSLWFYRYPPGHYGSPLPSAVEIRKNRDRLFQSTCLQKDGVDLNASGQERLLREIMPFMGEFKPHRIASNGKRYFHENPMFGFNDGFVLFAFLRKFKPQQVMEIGSGYSSALMVDTAEEYLPDCHFTFVDPYSTTVGPLLAGTPVGKFEIIRERVQDLDLNAFGKLRENDILFIDSSHVLKIGSDLSALLFAVLPSLSKGVIVHFHDICYPFEYPEKLMMEGRAWNEVYMIRAFLQFNQTFEILFLSSFVEKNFQQAIDENLPGYTCGDGNSLWLRKIA